MRSLFLLLTLSCWLVACTGPRPQEPTAPPPPPPPSYPAYETFDTVGYDAQPQAPAAPTSVEHDVPSDLMNGQVAAAAPARPSSRTVQGFRLQLGSSDTKRNADAVRDEVLDWWRSVRDNPDRPRFIPYDLDADIAFDRPYYKVRAGAFEYQDQAMAAVEYFRRRFPDTFLVPSRVTIR